MSEKKRFRITMTVDLDPNEWNNKFGSGQVRPDLSTTAAQAVWDKINGLGIQADVREV